MLDILNMLGITAANIFIFLFLLDLLFMIITAVGIARCQIIPEENKKFYQKEKKKGRRRRLLSETGICVKKIDNYKDIGKVKIGFRKYPARSKTGAWIEKGSAIKVTGVALNNYLLVEDRGIKY